ncbi:hypothetical protein FA15DRAFT_701088 [Coprinopsis marcescibilis]|uniref:Uncharacterized protein n=1 Tax=Coprinopsis marcescibilis TaxID=230819 RepID=A0A5C3L6N5_COPMA|nr:hypothetical protein FA15DRAFT_701088 [Coprinopsis marcescibilis]
MEPLALSALKWPSILLGAYVLYHFTLYLIGFRTTGVAKKSLAASVQSKYYGAYTSGNFSKLQAQGTMGATSLSWGDWVGTAVTVFSLLAWFVGDKVQM